MSTPPGFPSHIYLPRSGDNTVGLKALYFEGREIYFAQGTMSYRTLLCQTFATHMRTHTPPPHTPTEATARTNILTNLHSLKRAVSRDLIEMDEDSSTEQKTWQV